LFQTERWGEDEEAATRRAALLADLGSVQHFLALLNAQG
jgi:chaperone required for assembly of F1-ATPase